MERADDAFKRAFDWGIRNGLVTEPDAVRIWRMAERLMKGGQMPDEQATGPAEST
jgi:hypothetical protein